MPAKKDPRIDKYIAACQPFAQTLLKQLRKILLAACPEGEETVKWGMPHLLYQGSIVCGYAGFKQHCSLGFWEGRDVIGGEVTEGAGHFGRVTSMKDLPSARTLTSFVRKSMKVIDARAAGKKVPPPRAVEKRPNSPVRTPPDLLRSLRANRKALTHFEASSPTFRREYVEWITGAKTEETRERRLEQAVDWIAQGKSRNWKYR